MKSAGDLWAQCRENRQVRNVESPAPSGVKTDEKATFRIWLVVPLLPSLLLQPVSNLHIGLRWVFGIGEIGGIVETYPLSLYGTGCKSPSMLS
jgi:hypothetical protein